MSELLLTATPTPPQRTANQHRQQHHLNEQPEVHVVGRGYIGQPAREVNDLIHDAIHGSYPSTAKRPVCPVYAETAGDE